MDCSCNTYAEYNLVFFLRIDQSKNQNYFVNKMKKQLEMT